MITMSMLKQFKKFMGGFKSNNHPLIELDIDEARRMKYDRDRVLLENNYANLNVQNIRNVIR